MSADLQEARSPSPSSSPELGRDPPPYLQEDGEVSGEADSCDLVKHFHWKGSLPFQLPLQQVCQTPIFMF